MNKLAQDIVAFVASSSELNKRLLGENRALKSQVKTAADKQQEVLNYFLQNNVIGGQDEKIAADMLATHDGTLNFLKSAADELMATKAELLQRNAELGQGYGEKSANEKSAGLGGRTLRQSEQAYCEILNEI
jgi:hypothetical protein